MVWSRLRGQRTEESTNVFDRLFGKPDPRVHSVLDVVLADARRLDRTLGGTDKAKLAEYLDSVREVRETVQKAEAHATRDQQPPIPRPQGKPEDRGEYIRLMADLITIAFQQDLTRVATLVIDPERWDTPRVYHGVFEDPQNHHVLTHTKGDDAKETLEKIDRFHVEQFAYLIKRLSGISEGEGSLLGNCLVTYGREWGTAPFTTTTTCPL